jgi:hypothetical protein
MSVVGEELTLCGGGCGGTLGFRGDTGTFALQLITFALHFCCQVSDSASKSKFSKNETQSACFDPLGVPVTDSLFS